MYSKQYGMSIVSNQQTVRRPALNTKPFANRYEEAFI